MFAYRAIVFGLKHNRPLDVDVKAILMNRKLVVYFHNTCDGPEFCGRPNLHYHAIVEYASETADVNRDPVLLQLKRQFCSYLKCEPCEDPFEYLSPLQSNTEMLHYPDPSDLNARLTAAGAPNFESRMRKNDEWALRVKRNSYIDLFIDFILKSGKHDQGSLEKHFRSDESYRASLQDPDFLTCFHQAVKMANEMILDTSILQLCSCFVPLDPTAYMTPQESLAFVKAWCTFQKIDQKQFALDFIVLLDRKSLHCKRNTLYFQGEPYSEKSFIANSIIEVCNFAGKIIEESTGYSCVYEECTRKRLIVMHEPHFELSMSGQLMRVLDGTCTTIYRRNNTKTNLRSTPVLILSNDHCWASYPQLEQDVRSRLVNAYTGLKARRVRKDNNRKLHPAWLSLLVDEVHTKNERALLWSLTRDQSYRPTPEVASVFLSPEFSPQMSPPGPSTVTRLPVKKRRVSEMGGSVGDNGRSAHELSRNQESRRGPEVHDNVAVKQRAVNESEVSVASNGPSARVNPESGVNENVAVYQRMDNERGVSVACNGPSARVNPESGREVGRNVSGTAMKRCASGGAGNHASKRPFHPLWSN